MVVQDVCGDKRWHVTDGKTFDKKRNEVGVCFTKRMLDKKIIKSSWVVWSDDFIEDIGSFVEEMIKSRAMNHFGKKSWVLKL